MLNWQFLLTTRRTVDGENVFGTQFLIFFLLMLQTGSRANQDGQNTWYDTTPTPTPPSSSSWSRGFLNGLYPYNKKPCTEIMNHNSSFLFCYNFSLTHFSNYYFFFIFVQQSRRNPTYTFFNFFLLRYIWLGDKFSFSLFSLLSLELVKAATRGAAEWGIGTMSAQIV